MKIILIIIALFASLSPLNASEKECSESEIVCRILSLSPNTKVEKAKIYAKSITRHSKQQGVDPNLVIAIVKQESNFREVHTTRKVLSHKPYERNYVLSLIKAPEQSLREFHLIAYEEELFDLGLMQVNVNTAKYYGYEVDRLLKDPDYQIKVGIEILARKMRYCHDRDTPWACYHSKTDEFYAIYKDMVGRWM